MKRQWIYGLTKSHKLFDLSVRFFADSQTNRPAQIKKKIDFLSFFY